MELQDRLDGVGLTKAKFAELCEVGKSAVSNWENRGELPLQAEAILSEIEENNPTEVIPLGSLCDENGKYVRVIGIDRCERFGGSATVYWVSGAKEENGVWRTVGRSGRTIAKLLRRLPDVTWVDSMVEKTREKK